MSKNDKDKNKDKKILIILGSVIILLALIVGIIFLYMNETKDEDKNTLAYTDLIKEMSYGNIEKIEMTVGSTTVKVKMKNEEEEKTSIVPNTESFMELVQTKVSEGNEIELIQKPKSILAQIP